MRSNCASSARRTGDDDNAQNTITASARVLELLLQYADDLVAQFQKRLILIDDRSEADRIIVAS